MSSEGAAVDAYLAAKREANLLALLDDRIDIIREYRAAAEDLLGGGTLRDFQARVEAIEGRL